jgi:hypothetical protein
VRHFEIHPAYHPTERKARYIGQAYSIITCQSSPVRLTGAELPHQPGSFLLLTDIMLQEKDELP